jgi:hypothetical protein
MNAVGIARREFIKLGLSLPVAGLAGRALAQRTPEAGLADFGPFEVAGAERMDLVDGDRRTIATRAFFPAKAGRYPTILFSHGFGGSLATFNNTGRIWASHGYVVLHPTHSDSLAMMDPAVPAAAAAVMRKFREQRGAVERDVQAAFVKVLDDPFFLTSRLKDVAFLLQALKARGPGLDPQVLSRSDTSRMGMGGHSFGAYTTIVLSGAALSPPAAVPIPRDFAAYLSMSGQGPGRMSLTDDSFRTIVKPFMATTGTRDFGAAGETPPWRLKPWEESPPGRKYAAVVEGFRHSDFDPPPGDPQLGARGAELRRLQLQFWDSTLKGDRAAEAALRQEAAASKQTDAVWLRARLA